ncbi:uncharacterized protein LOC143695957 [Agelaius phoeniceus]|uniref:uncharacterized protein LOC143695957 n=1 Tax=Agelaius phoeniceus TaxID=39638 RepID=UPI004054DDAC
MRYEHVVLSMERKRAWDTLLCADTHHCAVRLLAREMRRVSIIWCCGMASCLFDLLSQGISDWELPALAFLVEVLDCLDLSECGKKVLEILTRHLQSESRQMRGVALRGLVVLTSMDPSMYSLTESLGKLLWDRDEDIVEKTLIVLSLLLLQKDLAIASPMALQLAEALWHLFDNVRLRAPSHGHLGAALGLGTGRPGAADVEGFGFLFNRTTALCSCSPFASSKT